MSIYQRNWAGNYAFHATRLYQPTTITELQQIVATSQKLKVLGSRHSFNSIADTDADHVSLELLDLPVVIDPERMTVTCPAGMRYGELALQLQQAGYAIHNLASLPHISIAGACITATHGSGNHNGNLATAVVGLEIVTADGDLVTLTREQDGDRFLGAVVSLGGLVISRITLEIMPAFMVQQEVYDNLPWEQLAAHFDEITASAYSVSLFTHWQPDRINQVWLKRRLADDTPLALAPEFFGATLAAAQRHPIDTLPGDPCTVQRGIPGVWYERLPHFRMEETPSHGAELQSEYFVQRQHAVAAMQAITQLHEQLAPWLLVSEVRTIAADALWLSPCYQQDSVGFHFTWKRDWEAVRGLLPQIESLLTPFTPRPHWGKLFTLPPAYVQAQYPRLPDFRQLLRDYDPSGKFHNDFLETYIFAEA